MSQHRNTRFDPFLIKKTQNKKTRKEINHTAQPSPKQHTTTTTTTYLLTVFRQFIQIFWTHWQFNHHHKISTVPRRAQLPSSFTCFVHRARVTVSGGDIFFFNHINVDHWHLHVQDPWVTFHQRPRFQMTGPFTPFGFVVPLASF